MEFTVDRRHFGTLNDAAVELVTLCNGTIEAAILTYGAALQAVRAPDREGQVGDIALGHATLHEYIDQPQFMGSTVGRVANRIAGGRFVLDGSEYEVPVNNGSNSLHGGSAGFDKANWQVLSLDTDGAAAVTLGHISPDSDQGYPGTLKVTARYALDADNKLQAEYRAASDAPTVVALSNHVYWNLAGEGSATSALDHVLMIPADHYLPTDSGAIPTGEFRPADGTAFDFRAPQRIGERVRDASEAQLHIGRGYDHNWVIARDVVDHLRLMARVSDPGSGRTMEVHSNQPGLQFYSGNFLDGSSIGKSGSMYRMGDAIALEPQQFPDTVNQPAFGSVRLEPGRTYRNVIEWRFGILSD